MTYVDDPSSGPTMVWVDGRVTDADQARVQALDHGMTVGDGVFETCKVVDGTPFALTRHLARLNRSASLLRMPPPMSDEALRSAIDEVISAAAAAGTDVGRIRITATGGPGPLGSERDPTRSTVVIAAGPSPPWPPTTEEITVPWTRNQHSAIAGAKSTSYAENVVALAEATARGASEAILANTAGALCEGTGSNIFIVRANELVTPSLSTGCLAGITRELILELVDYIESDALTLADLRDCEEAFLTSSTRDVHPISAVDGSPMLNAAPGPLTRQVAAAFGALQERTLDP